MIATGHLSDLGTHLSDLMHSDSEDAFLVIEVAESGDFLQLLTVSGQLRLDWPLLTPRQRSLEAELHTIAQELGLAIMAASDADEFPVVDIDIAGDTAQATRAVQRMLTELFDVNAQTPLRFELEA
jgi:hypothetical protein